MDKIKKRRALAGISCRSYTVDDWEQFQQVKETKAFKEKQKALKEQYNKMLANRKRKKGKLTKKDFQEVYDFVYIKQQKKYKPRLKIK